MAAITIANLSRKSKCENYSSTNYGFSSKLPIPIGNSSSENKMDKENAFRRPQNGWMDGSLNSLNQRSKNNLNINVKQIKTEANKTIQNVKGTIDSLSQKFRRSTRRRNRLEDVNDSPQKGFRSQRLSPVKLYSPFKIETPSKLSTRSYGTPGRYVGPRRRFQSFNSPSQTFRKDVEAVNEGTRQLNAMARGINNRSTFRN